jgi:hypothetical protein
VTKSHVKIQFTVYRVNQGVRLTNAIGSSDSGFLGSLVFGCSFLFFVKVRVLRKYTTDSTTSTAVATRDKISTIALMISCVVYDDSLQKGWCLTDPCIPAICTYAPAEFAIWYCEKTHHESSINCHCDQPTYRSRFYV